MERRELYEPEDIEQLLIERPYDELLEEERAFVLRHLSGRDEYEAMRALLLKVHDDDAHMAPVDAEPSVRAHVLDVFRAEQRPQWRIWLNSVHVFLLPKEASAMWRPALALGSVALVAWLVVIGTRQMERSNAPQLAELKETKGIEDEKAAKEKPQEPIAAPQEELRTEQAQPAANVVTNMDAVMDDAQADQPVAAFDMEAVAESQAGAESPVPPPPALVEAPDVAAAEDLDMVVKSDLAKKTVDAEMEETREPAMGAVSADTMLAFTPGAVTHVVTSNELVQNQSFSSASAPQAVETTVSGKSLQVFTLREKSKKHQERKRSAVWDSGDKEHEATADAGAYIGLLRAAW